MQITCPICYQAYDEQEHLPLIIPDCGHTLCRECMDKIATCSGSTYKIQCPLCKKQCERQGNPFKDSIDLAFPQNFALKQHIESTNASQTSIPKCIFHGNPICSLCLTDECQESRKCCLECVREKHSKCANKNFLLIDQIGKTIVIKDYTLDNIFYENALDSVIQEYLDSFIALLDTMLQTYKDKLIDFRVSMKSLKPDNSDFDFYSLKLMKNTPDYITIGPYNLKEFEELENHAAMLRETLEPIKSSLATKCIDFITDSFKNLTQARLDKNKIVEIKEKEAQKALTTHYLYSFVYPAKKD